MSRYSSLLFVLLFIIVSVVNNAYGDDVENVLCAEDIEFFDSLMTTASLSVASTSDSSDDDDDDGSQLKSTSASWSTTLRTPQPRYRAKSSGGQSNKIGNRTRPGYNDTVIPSEVDCFGLGWLSAKLRWMLNLRPQSSEEIDVKFYLSTRKQRGRVQIVPGEQFGLEWTDFDADKRTCVIVHGFMSHGSASWVLEMTQALLDRDDVNVLVVDWSEGGNSWKYWRAVANTRTVGADLTRFLRQLLSASGGTSARLHLIGHSLGAHICSYAAVQLGGVDRITGLDPAQPCFRSEDLDVLLDKTDARFVDVIHTNGRLQTRIGLGLPEPCGHADFYPNGGMKQPGCFIGKKTFLSKMLPISRAKLERAICSHGRAYMYFTESLQLHNNCTFMGHQWNMTYYGAKYVMDQSCSKETCAEMGINADPNSRGVFFVVTSDQVPFCVPNPRNSKLKTYLFSDWRPIKTKKQQEQEEAEERAEQNLFDTSMK